MALTNLKKELRKLADRKKAKILQRFFKTGKGEYGEGDKFLGITVPKLRDLVKKYWQDLSLADIDKLLQSKIHEERLIALFVSVKKFDDSNRHSKFVSKSANKFRLTPKIIYDFYLSHTKFINNWDLVDLSAPNMVGEYLIDKNRSVLFKLAKSQNLWKRRIAMLATFAFIKKGDFKDTLVIAKTLMNDNHDLIHKASGWMLREVGKRCGEKYLTDFLDAHYRQMPRTCLRYAIERLSKSQKEFYLKK